MYVGLKQPRGDGERCVTPARAAAKETRKKRQNGAFSMPQCSLMSMGTPPPPPFVISKLKFSYVNHTSFGSHSTNSIGQLLTSGKTVNRPRTLWSTKHEIVIVLQVSIVMRKFAVSQSFFVILKIIKKKTQQ